MTVTDVLCFKLAYCLGGNSKWLAKQYPTTYRIAKELEYFEKLPSTKKLHSLNSVYFRLLREFIGIKDGNKWKARLDYFLWQEGLFSVKDISVAQKSDLVAQLNAFVDTNNGLLSEVHSELELSLPQDVFIKVLGRTNRTEQSCWEDCYLLRRLHWDSKFRFENPVLDFYIMSTLSKDSALYSKLRVICCGRELPKVKDSSILTQRIAKLGEDRFIPLDKLATLGNVYRLGELDEVTTKIDELGMSCPVTTLDAWRSLEADATWLLAKVDSGDDFIELVSTCSTEGHNVVLVLPIEAEQYRKVVSGELPNVFFLAKDK